MARNLGHLVVPATVLVVSLRFCTGVHGRGIDVNEWPVVVLAQAAITNERVTGRRERLHAEPVRRLQVKREAMSVSRISRPADCFVVSNTATG